MRCGVVSSDLAPTTKKKKKKKKKGQEQVELEEKMFQKMERPDQYEEEWKEEPESVETGDTWTGLQEIAPHAPDIDLQKSKCGSDTRGKCSDQDKEEWKEEPESGRAGDTWTGPHSASRKPLASRSPIRLPMGENLSPAADDIDNDTTDQDRSETRRTESSAWGDGPISPKTLHHEDDRDFPDQPRTSNSKTKRRKFAPEYAGTVFGTWSAAAVRIMMALSVGTSSLAGAVCIGTEVELDKGEAVLRCPLPVNANATRQGIIIKYFPTPDSADTVMSCYWPEEEADKPVCSSDTFSLVAPLTDQVVAEVTVSRLMDSGVYKCQLYPLRDHKYFTPCHIHRFSDNGEGKRPAVMATPVVPSSATNRTTPGQEPLIMEAPPCVGQCGSVALTAAVLVLQVIIIILLVVNALYLKNPKNLQKLVTSEGKPMNSLDEAGSKSTVHPPAGLQLSPLQSCNLAVVRGLTEQHLNDLC